MGYGYARNSGIPFLANYEEALRIWESTLPIRGRTPVVKPLGKRGQVDQYQIAKTAEGNIECILYKTPVVTFYENGDIILRTDGWNSQSTCHFLSEVIPHTHSRVYGHKTTIRFYQYGKHNEFTIPINGELKLRKDAVGRIEIINPMQSATHKVTRKGANNVRERYKEFLAYLDRMCRLKGDRPTFMNNDVNLALGRILTDNYHNNPTTLSQEHKEDWVDVVAQFKEWASDTNSETKNDSYYKAISAMALAFGRDEWKAGNEPTLVSHTLLYKIACARFETLIRGIHRDEWFEQTLLPIGCVRKDSYGVYFEAGWRRYHEKMNPRRP